MLRATKQPTCPLRWTLLHPPLATSRGRARCFASCARSRPGRFTPGVPLVDSARVKSANRRHLPCRTHPVRHRLRHMTVIPCPVCGGPVALHGTRPACERGHAFGPAELQDALGREASTALLAAVRALEDWTTGAKWMLTQPRPTPHLQFEVDQAVRHAAILRELISAQDGIASQPAESTPQMPAPR